MALRHVVQCLALLSLQPLPAYAQHWATAETCRVDTPRIVEQAFGGDHDFIKQMSKVEANGIGRLWKITTTGGAVSHLWGTYHSNDPAILNLPPEFRDVLSKASVVATEFNPIPPSRRFIERRYADDRLWRPLRTNHKFSLRNKEVEAWIRSRMGTLRYGDKALDRLSDLGLVEALLSDPCNDFHKGIFPVQDDRILLLGVDAGARVTGLEEPDAFRTTLSRNDRADVARAIIEVYGSYLNPERVSDTRTTNFALYLQGRIGMLKAWDTAYINRVYGNARAAELIALVDNYLLVERNLTFVETARPLIAQGGAVLAVGAFHLLGEGGMIERLRAQGHLVERVVTAGETP